MWALCMYNTLESDVNNIGHMFYIISLWILIMTIYIGTVLHFTYVVFITIHVSTVLHFMYYSLRQFYYILRQLLHFTSKCYCILRRYYISHNYCNLRQYKVNDRTKKRIEQFWSLTPKTQHTICLFSIVTTPLITLYTFIFAQLATHSFIRNERPIHDLSADGIGMLHFYHFYSIQVEHFIFRKKITNICVWN